MQAKASALEKQRVELQRKLDTEKSQAERNRLGQFATPSALAMDVLRHAKTLVPSHKKLRFLDPAFGTGAFYAALLETFPKRRIVEALGFEIDAHYERPAAEIWTDTELKLTLADFTRVEPDGRKIDLLICNPPYVRHHHLQNGEKARLQLRTVQACGSKIAGLAGLYCYFLGIAHAWLAENAVSGWLIPSEFMDVNYGQAVKRYLLNRVTLLQIHRFDPSDVQFADALVSSAIVWFRNAPPPRDHRVKFTFGGSLLDPKLSKSVAASALGREPKWTRFPVSEVRAQATSPTVADLFKIKRGVATGDNGYFILSADEVEARGLPMEYLRPILPSPRYLKTDEVQADASGLPMIDRRMFLLDPTLPEAEIEMRFPSLWSYLQEGRAKGLHERYLCRHRALWYGQEKRLAPPIICTYLGRSDAKSGRPFRFILNHSKATVPNVYLAMYPTPLLAKAIVQEPELMRRVWQGLNRITPEALLGEGRVYGGGLHKLEPRELANVPLTEVANLLPKIDRSESQAELFLEEAA